MTERALQEIVAAYLDMWGVLWCHVPNEGKRAKHTGAMLRRAGLKKGVSDILIFESCMMETGIDSRVFMNTGRGLAIELKTAKGRLTKEQEQWLDDLERRGWRTAVCRSLEEVQEVCKVLRPLNGLKAPY